MADDILQGTLNDTVDSKDPTLNNPYPAGNSNKQYNPKRRKFLLEKLNEGIDPVKIKRMHVMSGFDEDEVDDAISTYQRLQTGAPRNEGETDQNTKNWATGVVNKVVTPEQAMKAGIDMNALMSEVSKMGMPDTNKEEEKENAAAVEGLDLTNRILEDDKHKGISGFIGGTTRTLPGTDAWQTASTFNQLKGALSLEKRQMLKGQGQISDFEFKVLGQAATDMDRSSSEDDFKKSLLKVRGVYQTALGEKARVKVKSPDGEVVPGQLSREEINDAIKQGFLVEYY